MTSAHRKPTAAAPGRLALLGGLLVAGWPAAAVAVDGMRVRTPVVWSDVPCMTIVDRSVQPVINLPYGIPFEDTKVTEDEVADGRTHQFFALCTDHDPTDELPGWISEADVAAAEALDLIDPGSVGSSQILDLHETWAGCALRIVPDAERRPISFAMAEAGVDWDTTAVPAGAWVVEGFTHDPAFNLWWPRPGVIKVVDDPDPSRSGPAAAVIGDEAVVPITEAVTIESCVSAMEGSSVSAEWAVVGDNTWVPFVDSELVEGSSFSTPLLLPPEMAGQSARVRVEVEDPQGRRYLAYRRELIITLPVPDPGCDEQDEPCDTTGGEPQDGSTGENGSDTSGPVGEGPGSDGGDAGTDGGDDAGQGGREDPGGGSAGCGCQQRPASGGLWWLGLGLMGLGLDPRRGRR